MDGIEQAISLMSGAQHVVVSTGAGMSQESGVPTFRDAQQGLWARYDPEQLATPDAFRNNPDLVWSWYMYRYSLVSDVKPNPGHHAITRLETLFPKVVVLTQNVDGLHIQAGSTDVVELHGNLCRFKCFGSCQGEPSLVDLTAISYDNARAPLCPYCKVDRIRPDVVWFGETLTAEALDRAYREAATCDVMLVIGTSGMVQPAASLPSIARQAGSIVIEVNAAESLITPLAHLSLRGPAGVVLPTFLEALEIGAV